MRIWAVATLFGLSACSLRPDDNGAQGPQGPPGAEGPQGPPGFRGPTGPASTSSSGQLIYRDALGQKVSGAVGLYNGGWSTGRTPAYVDARGYIWLVDPETGEVGAIFTIQAKMYAGPDCTGQAFFMVYPHAGGWNIPPPRMPIWVEEEHRYRARGDHQLVPSVPIVSQLFPGLPCQNTDSVAGRYFAISDESVPAEPIVLPSVSFAPPLHREVE